MKLDKVIINLKGKLITLTNVPQKYKIIFKRTMFEGQLQITSNLKDRTTNFERKLVQGKTNPGIWGLNFYL